MKSPIDQAVDRFLGWKLPADFAPDAGISFASVANAHMPAEYQYKHEPSGTNLFTADQAKAMFTHCFDDSEQRQRIVELEAEISHLRAVSNTAISFLKGSESVVAEVGAERVRQDLKWGGAGHDDTHSTSEFVQLIKDYAGWARVMAGMGSDAEARNRLIQVAALAVAAVESLDRKNAS